MPSGGKSMNQNAKWARMRVVECIECMDILESLECSGGLWSGMDILVPTATRSICFNSPLKGELHHSNRHAWNIGTPVELGRLFSLGT